jgi:hypothetical protein
MSTPDLAAALDLLADALASRVAAKLREGERGMLDQAASPLGRRRHINVVRRLHAQGDGGVAIVGRRYLATREVIDAELGRIGRRPADQADDLSALANELGLRLVDGGRR